MVRDCSERDSDCEANIRRKKSDFPDEIDSSEMEKKDKSSAEKGDIVDTEKRKR